MNDRTRAALLLGAVVLLAGGCTGGPTSTAGSTTSHSAAEQPAVNTAIPEADRAKAATFGRFRALDPCALFDLTTLTTISGDQVDELIPNLDGLNHCVARLTQGEFRGTWTLYLEVGAEYSASRRRNAAPETLGGKLTYTEEVNDGVGCDLARPLDGSSAIVLRVRNHNTGENKPAKHPCDVGREYIQGAAGLWADPPRRDRGLTTPALSLAALDPCAGAAALLDEYGDGAALHVSEPFKCGVRDGRGSGKGGKDKTAAKPTAEVTVSFGVEEAPLKLAGQKTATADHIALTVAGRKALATATKTGCTTSVVWDEDTWMVANADTADPPRTYQVITLRTESCDTAQATADKVVAAVGQR